MTYTRPPVCAGFWATMFRIGVVFLAFAMIVTPIVLPFLFMIGFAYARLIDFLNRTFPLS